jgi:hypothetical protein
MGEKVILGPVTKYFPDAGKPAIFLSTTFIKESFAIQQEHSIYFPDILPEYHIFFNARIRGGWGAKPIDGFYIYSSLFGVKPEEK